MTFSAGILELQGPDPCQGAMRKAANNFLDRAPRMALLPTIPVFLIVSGLSRMVNGLHNAPHPREG